jgi:hypothetical protein
MKPGPMLVMTAYDAVDDEDCGCETCTTSWGTEPLPVTVLDAPAAQETAAQLDLVLPQR